MIRRLIAAAAVSGTLALGVAGVGRRHRPVDDDPDVDRHARDALRQGREAGHQDSDARDQGGDVGAQGAGP